MTEKQLFYPLLSVYFSLILGDLQKEKLQIVSIFRFGHKKRGLFSALPRGGSPFLLCFVRFGFDSFPLGKVGIVDRSPSPALPKGRELIPAVF